jgi:pentatricopeptide repeat protein
MARDKAFWARVLAEFRKSDELRKQNSERLVENPRMLANTKLMLHQPEEAAELFREALDLDPREYTSVHGLLHVLVSQGKTDEAWSLLNRMNSEPAPVLGISELGMMHMELAIRNGSDDYFSTIFSITENTSDFEAVHKSLEAAVNAGRPQMTRQTASPSSSPIWGALLPARMLIKPKQYPSGNNATPWR